MGRATSACGGMGGSSYVIDASTGILGSPAIIGAGMPAKLRGYLEDRSGAS
jgi:TPP-dependent pyruvate/acetoin dehydrogenase alpha subunit